MHAASASGGLALQVRRSFALLALAALLVPLAATASTGPLVAAPVAPSFVQTSPGVPVDLVFVVRNPGSTSVSMTFAASGPAGWAAALRPAGATVAPGGSVLVTVTVTPTETPNRGIVRLDVASASGSASATGLVEIPLFTRLELGSDKWTTKGSVSGVVRVAYLDGSPAPGRGIVIREEWRPGGVLTGATRTRFVSTGADGVATFLFPADPLGANAPGDHRLTASAVDVANPGSTRQVGYTVAARLDAVFSLDAANDGSTNGYTTAAGGDRYAFSVDTEGETTVHDPLNTSELWRGLVAVAGWASDGFTGGYADADAIAAVEGTSCALVLRATAADGSLAPRPSCALA